MKTLKRIAIGLVILLVALILIAYLLPRNFSVVRQVTVHTGRSVIYDLVCDLHKWDLWTPWTKEVDSTAKYTYENANCQVGGKMKWNGKMLGNGELVITEIKTGEQVNYNLAFDHGKMKSAVRIILTAEGDSTKVSWFDEGDLGFNPISRYFGLFMDRILGPDFEKGLAKLKKVAEERKNWPVIELKQLERGNALLIRDSAGPAQYSKVIGKAYGELMAYIGKHKLVSRGGLFAIYLKYDSERQFSVMDIGMPVDKCEKGERRIRCENLPDQKVVMAYYFGPYEKTSSVYNILHQYIKESGLEEVGPPAEYYMTDPMAEKDTSKWETDIIFPVK